jgi:hypothetical protein
LTQFAPDILNFEITITAQFTGFADFAKDWIGTSEENSNRQ